MIEAKTKRINSRSRHRPDARRRWRRALQLDELFRGDRRVPITEISYPNWLFGLALEVLDRQRLMPRPDLRSHEGIGGLHDRRFLAEARHDRVETVRASIELAE